MSRDECNYKKCYLIPMISSTYPIFLPDGVEVTVGRSELSGIADATCSRKQVAVRADYFNEIVIVKSLGRFPSYFKGKPMTSNVDYHLRDNGVVSLIAGKLSYKVEFQTQKRSTDQSDNKGTTVIEKRMTFYWKVCGSGELLMCISSGFDETRAKVASFDLDKTLIKTKSGRVFGKDFDDWILWDDCIKNALADLAKKNYKIIIFTNQAGLGTVSGKNRVDGFKNKIEKIIEALNVPVQVFIAISNGLYRKPSPGMWFFMKMRCGLPVDLEQSFYVGDAAGRPENWKAGEKMDFAMSDRMFAINIGIKFYTPEEYFLKEPMARYAEIMFHPWQYDRNLKMPDLNLPSARQEVLVMVGSPGSGKTHFVKHFVQSHGYDVISRDKLGSWQKCVSLLKDILKSKRSAVIDNTNPDRISRQRFIEVGAKYNVPVRCFYMDSSLDRCLHNNKFREIIDSEHEIITSSLINKFHTDLERPSLEEGFSSITNIPFISYFENEEQEYFYNCYLVGK